MKTTYVTRDALVDFLADVDAGFGGFGRLYLVGETSLLFEGWREWVPRLELCADAPRGTGALDEAIAAAAERHGLFVINESPADVIPLPDGYESGARPVVLNSLRHLSLLHFDPCSVAFRFIARGDEPDYHLLLAFLEHGWVTMEEMDDKLDRLLPRFSMETIQQDPAEFRRKYKGMMQMSRAIAARTTHRPTSV